MNARRPLEGIRVIDMCVVWAGPWATMMLADLGAEVIKVENIHVLAPLGRARAARPSPRLLASLPPFVGGFPNGGNIPRPWNVSPTFVQGFRNKVACTIDLASPHGREAFERLVRVSDVFCENNVPETIDKLGLDEKRLWEINPNIIVARAPGFGLEGEYRNYRAVGTHIEAVAGHALLRHYPDTDPSTNTAMYGADAIVSCHLAFAIIAALEHRRVTGEAQLVEVSQVEASVPMLAQHLMDYAANGNVNHAVGNRSIHGEAPNGVFRTAGDDRWLALSVATDEQWAACCRVLGRPGWASDPRFATQEARLSHQDELEALISEAVRDRDANELTQALQEAGVPAGPVMDAADVFHDPHVRARGMLVKMPHPDVGDHEWLGTSWHFDNADVRMRTAPATLGEHNEYVYKEVLGYSDEEYQGFIERGEIGTEFDPSIP